MFDLIGEISRSTKQVLSEGMAKAAKVAKHETESGSVLAKDWLKVAKDDQELSSKQGEVQDLASLSQSLATQEFSSGVGFSHFSHFSQPRPINLNFLKETPFTKEMIMKGVQLYGQPFSQGDLDAIATGELTIVQARKYLFLWARQNRNDYLELKK